MRARWPCAERAAAVNERHLREERRDVTRELGRRRDGFATRGAARGLRRAFLRTVVLRDAFFAAAFFGGARFAALRPAGAVLRFAPGTDNFNCGGSFRLRRNAW